MNFGAVILAGGKSSRMGRDKAFLKLGGKTLLERQIETLTISGAEEISISGRRDADYAAFGCRVLMDHFSEAGPLAGIHTALKNSRWPLMLVLAVDLPEMNPMFLQSLLMASVAGGGVIPRVDGAIEPLAAIYPKSAVALAEQMMMERNFAVRRFAEACVRDKLASCDDFPAEFARLFKNLNTPDQLEALVYFP